MREGSRGDRLLLFLLSIYVSRLSALPRCEQKRVYQIGLKMKLCGQKYTLSN